MLSAVQPSACSERDCIKFIAPPVDSYNYKVNVVSLIIRISATPIQSLRTRNAHMLLEDHKGQSAKDIKTNFVPNQLL